MKRSGFNLSRYDLATFKMGVLYPLDVREVLPGDTFRKSSTALIRTLPLLAPLMHPVFCRIHHWFVPLRILWDECEEFFTRGPLGISKPVHPYVMINPEKHSIWDYFGIPPLPESNVNNNDLLKVNALPLRAYNLIYNEFYRDEDLIDPYDVPTNSGLDEISDFSLKRIAWQKDRFTVSRPWVQKGDEVFIPVFDRGDSNSSFKHYNIEVAFQRVSADFSLDEVNTGIYPLPEDAEVVTTVTLGNPAGLVSVLNSYEDPDAALLRFFQTHVPSQFQEGKWYYIPNPDNEVSCYSRFAKNSSWPYGYVALVFRVRSILVEKGVVAQSGFVQGENSSPIKTNVTTVGFQYGYIRGLRVWHDSSIVSTSSISVSAIREGLAKQRRNEHDSRYGSRIKERLAFLGVKSSDARLQLPEYLGGGKSVLQFSEVLQTAEGGSGVGSLYGKGLGAVKSNKFRAFFEEWGIMMTLISFQPVAMYASAVDKIWYRETLDDYWNPENQHLSMTAIKEKELYPTGVSGSLDDDYPFGYNEIYDEYRHAQSRIHGDFRDTLQHWHLARFFEKPPRLNKSFIECAPRDNIFSITNAGNVDHLLGMIHHECHAMRLLSKRGTPSII